MLIPTGSRSLLVAAAVVAALPPIRVGARPAAGAQPQSPHLGAEFASPPPVPDDRPASGRAFDFLYGSWTVHNRVLAERLAGSDEWREWEAQLDVIPILGGMGNVDRYRAMRGGEPYEGMTIRLYRPETDDWQLYWIDSSSHAVTPQVSGPMHATGGTFFGEEMFEGRMVRMRFVWSHDGGDDVRWEQAYETPEGEWEVNWIMTFTRRVSD